MKVEFFRAVLESLRHLIPWKNQRFLLNLCWKVKSTQHCASLAKRQPGGMLELMDDVMAQLKEKHPNPQPTTLGSLLFVPIDDDLPESVYSEINGEMVRQAALRTKGSGGPCGVDTYGFTRILACKSFKQSSTKLCEGPAD